MSHHDEAVLQGKPLGDLALEAWRLLKSVPSGVGDLGGAGVAIRYSARKMRQVLEESGCSYVDLTGHRYDVGMALDVLSVEGEAGIEGGDLFVKEMVSPIILWKDRVLRHGEAVLLKSSTDGSPPEPRKEERR
jgi:hypothetical protein